MGKMPRITQDWLSERMPQGQDTVGREPFGQDAQGLGSRGLWGRPHRQRCGPHKGIKKAPVSVLSGWRGPSSNIVLTQDIIHGRSENRT